MGFPVPNNIIKASKLLCKSVLLAKGGYSSVAAHCGLRRQDIYTYAVTRGYVPLITVYDISEALDVDIWALSYFKLMEIFGKKPKEFGYVVKSAPISVDLKKRILSIYEGRT